MKQKFFTLFATLLCCLSMFAGGTLEVQELEVYTEFVEETGMLTFYYDTHRLERTGVTEVYDPVNVNYSVRFEGYATKVKKAVIDPSMKDASLTSMEYLFCNLSAMTTIEGLENLNTENVTNMNSTFFMCTSLTSLDLSSFNTENVTTMIYMFCGCKSLTSLDLSSFNTENVTNMSGMFFYCLALTSLDLSSFNTAKVTDMSIMFHNCTALTSLDLSSFNTENVTEMYDMFMFCSALTSLDLSSFNTAKVTNMKRMFYECTTLTSLNLSSFNTENVTNMNGMFFSCNALTSLDLSSFNTAKVNNMGSMFPACYALTSLDLSSFNTKNVTDMKEMFHSCTALTLLDLSSFNTAKVKDMNKMFYNCPSLKTIYCDNDWSTTSANSDEMFLYCKKLVGGNGTEYISSNIDKTYARPDEGPSAPGYFTANTNVYTVFDESTGTLTYYHDTQRSERTGKTERYDPIRNPDAVRFIGYKEKVTKAVIDPSMKDAPLTSMEGMFFGGTNSEYPIQSLNNMTTIEGLENLNTAIVTNMESMFFSCSALKMLDLSSFETSNVTNMNGMFLGCNNLEIIDITLLDISNVTDMRMMFAGCSKLRTIRCLGDWSTSKAQSGYMFSVCNSLVGSQGTVFDSNVIDKTYARLDGGTINPGYFSIYQKGDADADGVVDAADIVAISNYMMGNPPTGFNKAAADINFDGVINIADIVAVTNILLE